MLCVKEFGFDARDILCVVFVYVCVCVCVRERERERVQLSRYMLSSGLQALFSLCVQSEQLQYSTVLSFFPPVSVRRRHQPV